MTYHLYSFWGFFDCHMIFLAIVLYHAWLPPSWSDTRCLFLMCLMAFLSCFKMRFRTSADLLSGSYPFQCCTLFLYLKIPSLIHDSRLLNGAGFSLTTREIDSSCQGLICKELLGILSVVFPPALWFLCKTQLGPQTPQGAFSCSKGLQPCLWIDQALCFTQSEVWQKQTIILYIWYLCQIKFQLRRFKEEIFWFYVL